MYDAIARTILHQTLAGGPAFLEVIKDLTIGWLYSIEIWAMVSAAGFVTQEVRANKIFNKYCKEFVCRPVILEEFSSERCQK